MLRLTDIRKDLKLDIQKNTSMPYLYALAEGKYNSTIDFDVNLPSKGRNLQRDFCWTLAQKQELIISVLKGIQLPGLAVIQHKTDEGRTIYKIVDGKQRLSTLIAFYKGEFAITFEGKDYFFNDLDEQAQDEIKLLKLSSDRVYEYPDKLIADDDKIRWFEMINFAGTAQDAAHIAALKS